MESSDRAEVLEATARLIEQAQKMAPTYGLGYAGRGWWGSGTNELADIFKETRTRIREMRLPEGFTAMALPDSLGDGHTIIVDPRSDPSDQMFSLRHELGHIIAGEVQHALFLQSEDTMSFSERRADLFAVADLTPTEWMRRISHRRRFLHVALEVKQTYRELTAGWSEQRLWDRARLRVQLYRELAI